MVPVVVNAYEPYNWIFEEFHACYKKLDWPLIFESGSGIWSTRLQKILEKLDDEDVLYMQEDFLIQHVDLNKLEEVYDLHKEMGTKIIKLATNYEFNYMRYGNTKHGDPINIQYSSDYMMSHQPIAFFNREFLLSTIKDIEYGASEHEICVTEEINKGIYGPMPILCIGNVYNPNKSDIITIDHAIRKGKRIAHN